MTAAAAPPRDIRVLLSAYACAPEEGSEPGVGWNWVRHLAPHVRLVVVTRANNREMIEQHLRAGDVGDVDWIWVDAPSWLLGFKRGRVGLAWYYPIWQVLAWRAARRHLRRQPVDLVHHVTFMSSGLAMAPFLQVPTVVGPVGGLQPLPKGFMRIARHPLKESVRSLRNRLRVMSPLWRLYLRRTKRYVVANQVNRDALPPWARERSTVLQVGFDPKFEMTAEKDAGAHFTVMWSGVHTGWKGLELALRAFRRFVSAEPANKSRLIVTGLGEDEGYFRALAAELGLDDYVQFLGWVDRDAYLRTLANADVFLFTSLRETTGVALLEAMAAGKACVVIAHAGPAEIATEAAARTVRADSPEQVVEDIAEALRELGRDPALVRLLGKRARDRVRTGYAWSAVASKMLGIYDEVLGSSTDSQASRY